MRLDVDDRRAQLIDVGMTQFSSRPYDELSVQDLADAAGISKGLLYHYFPGKREFYVAVLQHAADQLLGATTLPNEERPPAERLELGLRTYFQFVGRHGEAFVALMRGGIGTDPDVVTIVDGTREAFVERILAGLPEGLDSPLARVALRGWIGFVEAVAVDQVRNAEVSTDAAVALVMASMGGVLSGATGEAVL